jgi:hypothetical protein
MRHHFTIYIFLSFVIFSTSAVAKDKVDHLLQKQSALTRQHLNDSGFFKSAIEKALDESLEKPNLCNKAIESGVFKSKQVKDRWKEFSSFAGNNSILNGLKNVPASISQNSATESKSRSYLTETEAGRVLTRTGSKCKVEINTLSKGLCFLRSTAVAGVVAEDFPKVPVLKIWLVGPIISNGESWKYHTAPLIPVLNSQTQKIEWMVFDTLLPQPMTPDSWTHNFVSMGSPCGKAEVFISDTSKLGPNNNLTFSNKLLKASIKDWTKWENAVEKVVGEVNVCSE